MGGIAGEVDQLVGEDQLLGVDEHAGRADVISCMAAGMDMTKMITKHIGLGEVDSNAVLLQKDRNEVKITVTDFD